MRAWTFAKGHGTGNDFVILTDRNNWMHVTDADVRWLCDRRFGIGGDGVLRAVRAGNLPEWDGDPDLWFMDYRNADGSIAEMCGNGLRVFARHLEDSNLVSSARVTVATRAGVRTTQLLPGQQVAAEMGRVNVRGQVAEVTVGQRTWPAVGVEVGNPHAVVMLGPDDDLASLDLARPPLVSPAEVFPDGVNVEFVKVMDDRHMQLRVHERGSGETLSCGTGVVAVAAAHAASHGLTGSVRVEVPGGTLEVELAGDGRATLTGPAVIVAHGDVTLPDHD